MLDILGFETIQHEPPELVGIRFIRAVYDWVELRVELR